MARQLLRLRQSRSGVTAVTANLLMVVMTVGMGASLFVMTANLVSPYTPPQVSFLGLQSAGTYASGAPGYCCLNDSFVQIIDVGGDALVWGPRMQYQITSLTGEVLIRGDLEPAPLVDFYLGVFHAGPGIASIPRIGFIDVEPLDEVSAADTIQIYGMSEEYHGANLKISMAGRLLAEIDLD